jgi:hypothetical protein
MNEKFLETQGKKPEVQEYAMRMWAEIYACLDRKKDVAIAHVPEHKTIVKEKKHE